jgi:hypothetical protein
MEYESMQMGEPVVSALDKILYYVVYYFSLALPFLELAILVFAVCVLWKMLKAQRGIAAALDTANRINIEMFEALKNIGDTLEADKVSIVAPESDEEDEEKGREAPADFVYCPECSTRVEVDPGIRNINVVCPDCKKPFHIH